MEDIKSGGRTVIHQDYIIEIHQFFNQVPPRITFCLTQKGVLCIKIAHQYEGLWKLIDQILQITEHQLSRVTSHIFKTALNPRFNIQGT